MHGNLNIYCLECHQFVEWRKASLYREDGYTDWDLEVFCGCGPVDDLDISAMAREAYDLQLDVELATEQQNALDAALTKGGNLYFETLCRLADPAS